MKLKQTILHIDFLHETAPYQQFIPLKVKKKIRVLFFCYQFWAERI